MLKLPKIPTLSSLCINKPFLVRFGVITAYFDCGVHCARSVGPSNLSAPVVVLYIGDPI